MFWLNKYYYYYAFGKYHLYNTVCIPGLLDGLHPFITLTLLLCPQLQRFLSIMTKHDKEVVLRREKDRERKAAYICDPETKHIFQHHHSSVGCSFEMLATANQTYGADIWKRHFQIHLLFSCPDSSHIKFHSPYMNRAECTQTRAGDRTGEGGSTHMT